MTTTTTEPLGVRLGADGAVVLGSEYIPPDAHDPPGRGLAPPSERGSRPRHS